MSSFATHTFNQLIDKSKMSKSQCADRRCRFNCCDRSGQCPKSSDRCFQYYDNSVSWPYIVGGVIAAILLIIFISVAIYCYRKKKMEGKIDEPGLPQLTVEGPNGPQVFVLKKEGVDSRREKIEQIKQINQVKVNPYLASDAGYRQKESQASFT